MYPQPELTRLAAYKAALRRNIARNRTQCLVAAVRLAQPVAWLERLQVFGRRLAPLARVAAVPLGFLVARTLFPRLRILGLLVRWGPLVYGAVRGIRSADAPATSGPR